MPLRPPKHVYHLVDARNLASIRRHGLMSTERLLDLAGMAMDDKAVFLRDHRPKGIQLGNGVAIRDQSPMPPSALAGVLDGGMTPSDWYALLNRFVFFWPSMDRLDRHRRACGAREQVILTFDGEALFDHFRDRTFVAPINTGNARRRPARRGPDTLVPYAQWLTKGWPDRRASHPAAEFLVEDVVPDCQPRSCPRPQRFAGRIHVALPVEPARGRPGGQCGFSHRGRGSARRGQTGGHHAERRGHRSETDHQDLRLVHHGGCSAEHRVAHRHDRLG